MSDAVHGLLEGASAMLLDFDGPLAKLMPPPANAHAADAVRAALEGVSLPSGIASTTDHLAILRWSFEHLPAPLMLEVESACTRAEIDAAEVCPEAVNCFALLDYADRADLPVAVVSNNATVAVETFMRRTGWLSLVDVVSARTPDTVEWLKPRPELLLLAADALRIDIGSAVFFGDAVSDVTAAKRAGCKVVGMYKNPERMRELDAAGADLIMNLSNAVV